MREYSFALSAYILTLAILSLLTILTEWICWRLFRRKMEALRFPVTSGQNALHTFWIGRLRLLAICHTIGLLLFLWFFNYFLW